MDVGEWLEPVGEMGGHRAEILGLGHDGVDAVPLVASTSRSPAGLMTSERGPAGALRILLAHDLSAPAEEAAGLVAGADWPGATVVRVITSSLGLGPVLPSFASPAEARSHARELRGTIEVAHERLAAELRRAGAAVEVRIVSGTPERAIVAEADDFDADLIVVGARGQGSVAATLLGSVSRAVVENSSRSVLVARMPAARRVLLATDGSAPAASASGIVASWPIFANASILLVAVGRPSPRYPRAVLGQAEGRSAFRDTIRASTDEACNVAEQAAASLAAGDRDVEVEVRLGDVATEIVAAARAWSADMIVVGSNSRPLLHRLFVGSVARAVLDGAAASVLVARSPADGQGGHA